MVLSGDTRPTDNFVHFASGGDLFHEVAAARPELLALSPAARRIIGHHTTSEQTTVFTRVRPRLAVYTHIVLLTTDPAVPPPTLQEVQRVTTAGYPGRVEMGEDLMRVEVGDSIVVTRPAAVSVP